MMNDNLQDFENVILNKENTKEIKYTIDTDIETSVRYEYLCEMFGKEKTDVAIKESGFEISDLYHIDTFNIITEILNESSI